MYFVDDGATMQDSATGTRVESNRGGSFQSRVNS